MAGLGNVRDVCGCVGVGLGVRQVMTRAMVKLTDSTSILTTERMDEVVGLPWTTLAAQPPKPPSRPSPPSPPERGVCAALYLHFMQGVRGVAPPVLPSHCSAVEQHVESSGSLLDCSILLDVIYVFYCYAVVGFTSWGCHKS